MQLISNPMNCRVTLIAKDLNVVAMIYSAVLCLKNMMSLQ